MHMTMCHPNVKQVDEKGNIPGGEKDNEDDGGGGVEGEEEEGELELEGEEDEEGEESGATDEEEAEIGEEMEENDEGLIEPNENRDGRVEEDDCGEGGERDYEALIDRDIRRTSASALLKRKNSISSAGVTSSPSSGASIKVPRPSYSFAKISSWSSSSSTSSSSAVRPHRFKCGYVGCSFSAATYQAVNSHKRHHLNRSREQPPEISFKCPLCGKISQGEKT